MELTRDSHGDRADDLIERYFQRALNRLPTWPTLVALPTQERLNDLYAGCLAWGAVGDALGRPVEGRSPLEIRHRYGPAGVTGYVPWHGWQGGPTGTYTDDTQLTLEVARNLLAHAGRIDPEALGKQLIAWLPYGRGMGRATVSAIRHLISGEPWWRAGAAVESAGNGGAMRAAPVGLVHAFGLTPEQLKRDAVLSCVVTHTHPVGVASAVAMAAGVAWCIRARIDAPAQALDVPAFVQFVCQMIAGMEPGPTPQRNNGGQPVRLAERIGELPELLRWPDPGDVFAHTHNGAFALESVPVALYCFLRSPENPGLVVRTAVNAGYDADSVGSMAGHLAGAWNGLHVLREQHADWWQELEGNGDFLVLGEQLALQARLAAEPAASE